MWLVKSLVTPAQVVAGLGVVVAVVADPVLDHRQDDVAQLSGVHRELAGEPLDDPLAGVDAPPPPRTGDSWEERCRGCGVHAQSPAGLEADQLVAVLDAGLPGGVGLPADSGSFQTVAPPPWRSCGSGRSRQPRSLDAVVSEAAVSLSDGGGDLLDMRTV